MQIITDTNIGGAGRLLINQLKYTDREKFDVTVVLPKGSLLCRPIHDLGYRVILTKAGTDKSFCFSDVREYRKVIKKEKPDIVHCHSALSARIAAYLEKVKVRIYTKHCVYPQSILKTNILSRSVIGSINRALSTKTVAVAQAAADELVSLGSRREDIEVIINGVEGLTKYSNEEKLKFRRQLGINEDEFVCGIFARLEECKGHRYLIEAVKLLPEKSRIRVLVCGTGSMKDELLSLVEEYGIQNRFIFTGFCDDVTPYMNVCDVNINCSVGTETSSLALSEGMSIGLPSIVSDYGGNTYMVRDGKNGIVVPRRVPIALSAAIYKLERDKDMLEYMSKSAEKYYYEYFTARKMTDKLEDLYQNELKKRG